MKSANRDGIKRIDFLIQVGLFFSLLTFLILNFSETVADPDLWGYLSFGRLFWHSNKFPYQDVFSYVPTLNPWVYHEWLTGVLFYPLYQTLGGPGLQILKYTLGLATITLVYLTARRRGAPPFIAALVISLVFSVVASNAYSPVRAQVFTFFFFALCLFILERAKLSGDWRGLYWLPVIQLVWCNLHGGFLAGLGLVIIYALGEFISRRPFLLYLLVLIPSVLVTLINPYGLDYWEYLGHAVTMPRPYITEWASLFRSYQLGLANIWLLIYLLTLILVILLAMWQSRWREVTSSLALAVTMVLSLRHIRHLPFFLILVGAYLPICFQKNVEFVQSRPWVRRLWQLTSVKMAFLISLSLLTLVNLFLVIKKNPLSLVTPGTLNSQRPPVDFLPYPVGAVKFIKEKGLSGTILAHFGWGEFIIWELYPQCLVGFDGRYETVYPPEVEKKFAEFIYGRPQWHQFLEDYPPDLILLKQQDNVAKLLQEELTYRQLYCDSTSVLFVAYKKKSKVLPKEILCQ